MKTELTTTYALYSVATTVSVIQLFYWFQLNDKLGPVVISASQVVRDVFTISSMYVIFLVAFSGGIIFIIGTEKVAQSFRVQFLFTANSSRDDESGYLYNFAKTMEVLLVRKPNCRRRPASNCQFQHFILHFPGKSLPSFSEIPVAFSMSKYYFMIKSESRIVSLTMFDVRDLFWGESFAGMDCFSIAD